MLSDGVTTILDAVSRWGPDPKAYRALGNIAVAVEPQAELLLFNYTARANYENTWNAVEIASRGLIVHWPSAQITALRFPSSSTLASDRRRRLMR